MKRRNASLVTSLHAMWWRQLYLERSDDVRAVQSMLSCLSVFLVVSFFTLGNSSPFSDRVVRLSRSHQIATAWCCKGSPHWRHRLVDVSPPGGERCNRVMASSRRGWPKTIQLSSCCNSCEPVTAAAVNEHMWRHRTGWRHGQRASQGYSTSSHH